MAETIKIDFQHPETFDKIKDVLSQGGVIAFPTDTFYGLGVNPFNERAVARIFKIKKRSPQKPILVLIDSIKQLDQLTCNITAETEKLMQHLWPGPLTLLFKALPHLPGNLTAGTGKIGVRLPDHDFSRRLIKSLDSALTASSANFSGSPSVQTAEEINALMGADIDLIVDGGKTPGGKESTVLDATVSPPKLIREGAISRTQIEDVLSLSLA